MISQLVPIILLLVILISLTNCQSTNLRQNDIQYIDVQIRENAPRHHTTEYRQTRFMNLFNIVGPSIVLRRGEIFTIGLALRLPYDRSKDLLGLEFTYGPKPQSDKGTLVYIPVEPEVAPLQNVTNNKWNARVTKFLGNQLEVQTRLPANLAIGIWRLKITIRANGGQVVRASVATSSLYVIFNPWSVEDSVYMGHDYARQEYVMNQIGKIYIGNYHLTQGRKWHYGQFHEAVLPGVMMMLDRTRLDINDRADVVKVSRAVSALVNSHDDNGLLVGNWSGTYGDGLAPWQWTGSATIFEKYLQSGGRPVKFGQCWVFGGVTTTVLRTLGIPARTISNFVSAHDTDHSLTVDKFYDQVGNEIKGVNGDSIWNFHVWSDAWMARYDLPPGYGGWQAIDATPQETSMGMYQLGPASLEAIKQAKVGFAYDVGFVYSEVNADVVHWHLQRGQWVRTSRMTDHVGRKVLNKKMGVLDEYSRQGNSDAEDIVDQYKLTEGTKEERHAYDDAMRYAGLDSVIG